MKIEKKPPLRAKMLSSMGLSWHTDADNLPYISEELISVTEAEAEAFYAAGNELYEMFINAAQHVIDNDLFFELNIPPRLVNMIKLSWEADIHWHIYGRFDLAGGLDGRPIKLLEFNADTPTMVYETSLIQWAALKAWGEDESAQFNDLADGLRENFKRLITLEDSTDAFDELYEGWKILFSSIRGSDEEERTMRYLAHLAAEAGFQTEFAYFDEVEFNENEGVFFNGQKFEFFFKLVPWENIAIDEPELVLIMEKMMENKCAIFLNPAYTLLFQSKGILKILWDLYPNHPLLLETSFAPLKNKKQVKKPAFGREGANVEIIALDGSILESTPGIYANHRFIYQEYAEQNSAYDTDSAPSRNSDLSSSQESERNSDSVVAKYQPNLFFAFEPCALAFRKGGEIINNFSKFVSHKLI